MGGSFSTKFKLHTGALNQSENQTRDYERFLLQIYCEISEGSGDIL